MNVGSSRWLGNERASAILLNQDFAAEKWGSAASEFGGQSLNQAAGDREPVLG